MPLHETEADRRYRPLAHKRCALSSSYLIANRYSFAPIHPVLRRRSFGFRVRHHFFDALLISFFTLILCTNFTKLSHRQSSDRNNGVAIGRHRHTRHRWLPLPSDPLIHRMPCTLCTAFGCVTQIVCAVTEKFFCFDYPKALISGWHRLVMREKALQRGSRGGGGGQWRLRAYDCGIYCIGFIIEWQSEPSERTDTKWRAKQIQYSLGISQWMPLLMGFAFS